MYYPKSQIKTNLYANKGVFIVKATKTSFEGYYFETSQGKYFSGKTPNEANPVELIKISSLPINKDIQGNTTQDNGPLLYEVSTDPIYDFLKPTPNNQKLPINYAVKPTEQDYQNGSFTRYFLKKANGYVYLETNNFDYSNIISKNSSYAWYLYTPFLIKWTLTGEKEQVYRTNKNLVEMQMKKLRLNGFNSFLKEDYLKYYR